MLGIGQNPDSLGLGLGLTHHSLLSGGFVVQIEHAAVATELWLMAQGQSRRCRNDARETSFPAHQRRMLPFRFHFGHLNHDPVICGDPPARLAPALGSTNFEEV